MFQDENFSIAILGENKFEILQLIIYGWLKKIKIVVCPPGIPLRIQSMLQRLPFIKKYTRQSIRMHNGDISFDKGVAYKMHDECMGLTARFFNENVKNIDWLFDYYNCLFDTNKYAAYIKKTISFHIYALLNKFHYLRLFNMLEREILIIKSPVSEFVVAYMQDNYKIKYRIRWLRPLWALPSLLGYYARLFKEFVRRGVVFNIAKKEYKLSKESVWRFLSRTIRDDMLIDNDKFKKNDILLLQFVKDGAGRDKAFKEAKERGFDTASIPELKININRNIFNILYIYILVPVRVYLQLFLRRQLYFFYCIFLFHQNAFPIEILMNLYKIGCHITTKEWGCVEEAIIFNRYGTNEIAFHWSDVSGGATCFHAFAAHNIYFTWGNIHYVQQANTSYVDKWINIGCIYKKGYNIAVKNKEQLMDKINKIRKERKTITFFDTSFAVFTQYSKYFFMEYMDIIKDFCRRNREINILFKPKNSKEDVLTQLEEYGVSYKAILQELTGYGNFIYLNRLHWDAEKVIAMSDVCVSMGMNSAVTIALICGKNALYFDPTGNNLHPLAHRMYINRIVFEDKESLFSQIDNILNGRFDCQEFIGKQKIHDYDAFDDDNALERLKDNLYKLTTL